MTDMPPTVDVVDPQPVFQVGLARGIAHDGSFRVGEVRSDPGSLTSPAGERDRTGRLVVLGLLATESGDVEGVRRLSEAGCSVVVLVPDEAWPALPELRRYASGGVSRDAELSMVLDALRTVADGRSYWFLGSPTRPPHRSALTARERDVLDLLALGCSDREIATDLCISVRTVGSHLERVRAKTGLHSRVELALLALGVALGRDGRDGRDDGDSHHRRAHSSDRIRSRAS